MADPGRVQIMTGQLKDLQNCVRLCLEKNEFYRRKWGIKGLNRCPESFQDYQAHWPTTTKTELLEDQENTPPFGTNLNFPLSDYTRFHQTSGTTGKPLRWLDTPESWDGLVDNWIAVYHVAGVTSGDRVFFTFSFGPFLGFWTAYSAAEKLGALCIPGGGMGTKARLKMMIDNAATVVCCTPTYALHLGEIARTEGMSSSDFSLRTIIIAGEPGGSIPATRARLESSWPGVRFVDHHGMTEVGPVTYECPDRKGVLHVIEKGYFAEVLDPKTLEPVERDQRGELVLTTLNRISSPLLRYRTGDLVQVSHETQCPCGRWEMALEGGLLGRIDDMVIVRGVNLYPSAVESVLREFKEIVEYQARVVGEKALNELKVDIELESEVDANRLQSLIQHRLQEAFSLRIPVTIQPSGSLPRFEMKARRWIRE